VAAGLFVLWRERQLGLKRARDAEGPPSGAWRRCDTSLLFTPPRLASSAGSPAQTKGRAKKAGTASPPNHVRMRSRSAWCQVANAAWRFRAKL